MKFKQLIIRLWKDFLSIWYMPKWLGIIICFYVGHKVAGTPRIYEQERLKKKGDTMLVKHKYDNYIILSCPRCGKHLKTVRRERKQSVVQARNNVRKMFNKKGP